MGGEGRREVNRPVGASRAPRPHLPALLIFAAALTSRLLLFLNSLVLLSNWPVPSQSRVPSFLLDTPFHTVHFARPHLPTPS